MPFNQDQFNEMYKLLVHVYRFSPSAAGEAITKIQDEADNRASADPDIRYNQMLADASKAGERWKSADERWGKSVDNLNAYANNPENFRLGPISGVADFVQGKDLRENERLSGVRMLRNYIQSQDQLRAEQEKKDALWVQAWSRANAPQVDARGMIMSGTGGTQKMDMAGNPMVPTGTIPLPPGVK